MRSRTPKIDGDRKSIVDGARPKRAEKPGTARVQQDIPSEARALKAKVREEVGAVVKPRTARSMLRIPGEPIEKYVRVADWSAARKVTLTPGNSLSIEIASSMCEGCSTCDYRVQTARRTLGGVPRSCYDFQRGNLKFWVDITTMDEALAFLREMLGFEIRVL